MSYALHTLGWANFQSLSATILREILGQAFQTFADTADAGRDGAFHGTWKPRAGESLQGSCVVQCKFTAKPSSTLNLGMVADELVKAQRLAKRGLAQSYLLITNASLRAPVEEELRSRFLAIRGIHHFLAFGGEWITQQIKENQRLRTLVPRLYGLGDLTEILDDRVYAQAEEILSWLGDELERFVVTDAHHRSVNALRERGFVFLLGDPGSGKSTIAAALALAAADTWRSRVVKVRNADEFVHHWSPREPNQFFWMDDAFGQRQYERERALEWNQTLPHLSAALRRGARVIFTSRGYIYKAAIEDLKGSMFPLLKESQVVIEVEELAQHEREQILYNHLRLGGQPASFRRAVKEVLSRVAAHKAFLPETARRLADPLFTNKVRPYIASILHFVAEPEEYLRDVIEGLGDANRAALGLAFMRGGKLRAGLELDSTEGRALALMNASVGAVRKSLQALEGSLISRRIEDGESVYGFKHPTIRDALGGFISEDPNLMDVYLRGARAETLLTEVTCGDVGIEGVKLIIPKDRFGVIHSRLRELLPEPGGHKRLASFLSVRCCVEFLALFLSREPTFLGAVQLNGWLEWSEEAKLFGLLNEVGLLPEKQRTRFVRIASHTAMNYPEWRFMQNPKLRSIFRASELRSLRRQVHQHLKARRLDAERESWRHAWEQSGDEDPGSYFWIWSRELDAFAKEFQANKMLHKRFVAASRRLKEMIEELKRDWRAKDGDLKADTTKEEPRSGRSVFEDVDEEC